MIDETRETRQQGESALAEEAIWLQALDRVIAAIGWVRLRIGISSGHMGILSGFLFLFTALFITWDVLARKYFIGLASQGTDEISGYALAIGGSWSMAYALVNKGHVRVDVLLVKLPRVVQGYMNLLALFILNIFLGIVVLRAWELVFFRFKINEEANTVLRIPLGWPTSVWVVGYTVIFLLAFLMLLEGILEAVRGKAGLLAAKLGPRSVEAEAEEAIEAAALSLGAIEGLEVELEGLELDVEPSRPPSGGLPSGGGSDPGDDPEEQDKAGEQP